MNNPFEGKAIKFETEQELNHLMEIANSCDLAVCKSIFSTDFPYYTYLSSMVGYGVTNFPNNVSKIIYSDFIASLEPTPNHTEQQPNIQSAPGHTILDTAKGLIYGDRLKDYGKTVDNFNAIAVGWTEIAKTPLTPEQVALMMIWLKVCRANNDNCEKEDSIIDIAGYAGCIEKIKKGL